MKTLCYAWLTIAALVCLGFLGYACAVNEELRFAIGGLVFFIVTILSFNYVTINNK